MSGPSPDDLHQARRWQVEVIEGRYPSDLLDPSPATVEALADAARRVVAKVRRATGE